MLSLQQYWSIHPDFFVSFTLHSCLTWRWHQANRNVITNALWNEFMIMESHMIDEWCMNGYCMTCSNSYITCLQVRSVAETIIYIYIYIISCIGWHSNIWLAFLLKEDLHTLKYWSKSKYHAEQGLYGWLLVVHRSMNVLPHVQIILVSIETRTRSTK